MDASALDMTLYHQFQGYEDLVDVYVKPVKLINSLIVSHHKIEPPCLNSGMDAITCPSEEELLDGSWIPNKTRPNRQFLWKTGPCIFNSSLFDGNNHALHPCLEESSSLPRINITLIGDSHMRVAASEFLSRINRVASRDFSSAMTVNQQYTEWHPYPPYDTKLVKAGRLWIRLIGDARLLDDFAWREANDIGDTSDVIIFTTGQWEMRDEHNMDDISGHWTTKQYLNRLTNYVDALVNYRHIREGSGRKLALFYQTMPAYPVFNETRDLFYNSFDMRTHRRMHYRVKKSMDLVSPAGTRNVTLI